MAITFGAAVDDHPRFKSFTVDTANVDIATTAATIDLTTAGMTDFIGQVTSWGMTPVLASNVAPDVQQDYQIVPVTTGSVTTGFTITKLTPTVGASAEKMQYLVWARVDRGIMG